MMVKRSGAETVFSKCEAEHEAAKTKLQQDLSLEEKEIREAFKRWIERLLKS